MLTNAANCRNPGYTRRNRPRYRSGTDAITCRSNHSIGRLVARLFTSVGLTLASIGPAISVRLRGTAALPSSAISAVAASADTHGWHTASMCAPGPIVSMKRMTSSV